MNHKKSSIYTAVIAAIAIASTVSVADAEEKNQTKDTTTTTEKDLVECKIVRDGKGMIKENKGDCSGSSDDKSKISYSSNKEQKSSCAGQNKAGDVNAWIVIPEETCAQLNNPDLTLDEFNKMPKEVKSSLDDNFTKTIKVKEVKDNTVK